MGTFRCAVFYFTGLRLGRGDPEPVPLRTGHLAWAPGFGFFIGALLASLYLPLSDLFLPHEVAVAVLIPLAIFLGGGRVETEACRLFACIFSQSSETKTAIGGAALLFAVSLVFLKYTILRQFLGGELCRAVILGSTAALLVPTVLSVGFSDRIRGQPVALSRLTRSLLILLWFILVWCFVGTPWSPDSSLHPIFHLVQWTRPVVLVAGAAFAGGVLGAAFLRESENRLPSPTSGLALGFLAEIAVLMAFLLVRTQFL